MTFDDIPTGAAVFVDANTFVYAVLNDPAYGAACSKLLDRIEHQDVRGLTSSHVLQEVVHRIMTMEACARFNWPARGIAGRLRKHPAEAQQLLIPRRAIDEIQAAGVMGLPVTEQQVSRSVDIVKQFGLLSADALIVAVMRDHGLTLLASLDSDFDPVPGLTRYAPA
jgi:predicted nucleic acid-binding protein